MLTRHARADDVQVHGESPVDFLGEEERAVGGTAVERKLPGFLPGSPLYGFGFESHPTTSGWEPWSLWKSVGQTALGCYWNVSCEVVGGPQLL